MFLVDTNVWIERLLDQERSEEVGQFLDAVPPDALSITDFALHSICLVLCRLGQQEGLLRFLQDLFEDGAVFLVHLGPEDIPYCWIGCSDSGWTLTTPTSTWPPRNTV
ncbi:MAG: hypothetical protein N2556_08520 [Anaerolineae bacterium]|nr:hypothetical protein [Anaerolineae bacterium]